MGKVGGEGGKGGGVEKEKRGMLGSVYGMVVVKVGVGGRELEYVGRDGEGNGVEREDDRGMCLVEK